MVREFDRECFRCDAAQPHAADGCAFARLAQPLFAIHPWTSPRRFQPMVVEHDRTDPLPIGLSDYDQDGLNEFASRDLSSILASAIHDADNALNRHGQPTTRITLPVIDTFVLGQLFQMLMIATAIESRLLGLDFNVSSKQTSQTLIKTRNHEILGRS